MVDVIEQIKAYDIPTNSFAQAVRYMTEDPGKYAEISLDDAMLMIRNITEIEVPPPGDELTTRYTLFYIVQEAVRLHVLGSDVEPKTVYNLGVQKATGLFEKNPWMLAKPEQEEKVDELTGKPKMKKGKKQELAPELYQKHRDEGKDKIIEVFQTELDMSKAGARTYYYNMRKKFGDA